MNGVTKERTFSCRYFYILYIISCTDGQLDTSFVSHCMKSTVFITDCCMLATWRTRQHDTKHFQQRFCTANLRFWVLSWAGYSWGKKYCMLRTVGYFLVPASFYF